MYERPAGCVENSVRSHSTEFFRESNVHPSPPNRPMQKPLPVFLALFAICAAALAQDTPAATPKPKAKTATAKPAAEKPTFVPTATPAPAPDATPAPKSPGVLEILFGSRHKRPPGPAEPAPAPTAATPAPATPAPATPKPHAKRAPKPKAKKVASPAPAKLEPAPTDTPPAAATPHGKKHKPKAKPAETEPAPAEPAAPKPDAPETVKPAPEKPPTPAPEAVAPIKKPRKGKGTPGTAAKDGVEPPPDADPETKEKFRFDQVKAKASEDAEVMELKAKADGAVSDEDARSAQRAYNKALYNKMRKIDGTLDERINAMEAAVLKRLDAK